MSVPLIHLTKKNVVWSWTEEEEQTCGKLKAAVTPAPCLALIDSADEQNELILYANVLQVGLNSALVVWVQQHG